MLADFFRFLFTLPARLIYRVQIEGGERLPAQGGVLLLPNHISYVDAVILQLACPRPVRFLVYEDIYHAPGLHWILQLFGAIPISSRRAKAAIDAAVTALQRGEVVCIFPEGALTRTAALQKLNRGYELIAKKAGVPVLPVWMENLWGSVFSSSGGRFFWKWPKALPYHVWVYFGQLSPVEQAPADKVRSELYRLGERAFSTRPELQRHLGYAAIRGLKRNIFRPVITDAFQKGRTLKGGMLLAIGFVFAAWLKKNVPSKRVGIVLPPGLGATLANLACVLADKTPVNLNFTAGRAANESALRRTEIQAILTTPMVAEKLKDFPWPADPRAQVDIALLLKSFSKAAIFGWLAAIALLPSSWLRRMASVPETGRDAEATLLFTSGSSGEPKGVVVSHRNVLANIAQIDAIFATIRLDSVLGCLPIFHSFGCTVTMWWPLLGGPRVVTYISPLETQKLAEAVDKYKISLLIITPTFLRSWLRKAKPEQLHSLKFIVTGAEKLPPELAREFEARFNVTVCEGYGMTEATPVVSVNLPDEPVSRRNPDGVLGRRIGSVGRLLPGISPSIRDPETGASRSLFESGMLWLRGANIFDGYLNDAKRSAEVLHDSWYNTGDIGRLDEDGFLHIEGRLSRFSKIGGEMVPHGTVEQKIIEALGQNTEGEAPALIVVGVPDETKGEALVVLSTQPIDLPGLRPKLIELGLTNLWIPKSVKVIAALPLLATGKLDLKACQDLARARVETSVG
jgi:acyl-[acyl-carrier-protein]-phospholipid O-acyltransferase / long-chain-fatty-acid--[acyl-carrier-protein] ligase